MISQFINMFKRQQENLFILIFFVVLSFSYLGADIFSEEIVAPMDLLLRNPGWKGANDDIPLFNAERSDILDLYLPTWNFARNSILNGELPLWNPFRTLGSMCITIFNYGLFSIGFIFFLIFGDGIGFTLSLIARVAIAGIGTYKLCRIELTVLPSVFGGITYMMCGFNSSWLMWPQVETSMWIPWLLWAIIILDKERTKWRLIILASITAMMIFAGFPFIAFSGLLLASLMILWLTILKIKRKNTSAGLRSGLLLSSGLGAGILLASVQILPFVEWLNRFDIGWRRGGSHFQSFNDIDILWSPFKYVHDFGTNVVPRVEFCGYVGKITLLFTVLGIIYLIIKNNKKVEDQLYPIFWIAISGLTLIPIFDIKPFSDIVYQLPFFNSNANTRLLAVLGLSFSVLGAYGFSLFMNLNYHIFKQQINNPKLTKYICLMLAILIIIVHTNDMSIVGRSQNAIVPRETFYPDTPTIDYIKNNIFPGQSVLATKTYLCSGTLTYYDIPEWFAHDYHTSIEKETLSNLVTNAWKSPTAAWFTFDQIDLNSDYMDKLGIRYILTSTTYVLSQNHNNKPAPSMPSNKLGQSFNLSVPATISGVSLLMATYGKSSADGYLVSLSLYDKNNNIIMDSHVDGTNISDNTWIVFKFDESIILSPGRYSFEIRTEGEGRYTTPITIWSTQEDTLQDGSMLVNGMPANGDLTFRILESHDHEEWNHFSVENNIDILENVNCPPGAYFVYEDGNITYSQDTIKLIRFTPTNRKYIIKSDRPGVFVMTSRYWPEWEAYCNGSAIDIQSYLGMLSAIKINNGLSIIEFKYKPYSFYTGLIVSVIILISLILIPRRFFVYFS